MEPEQAMYSAIGFTGGVLAIEDMDGGYFVGGIPLRFRTMPLAFQFNGEISSEEYVYDDDSIYYEGRRRLMSLDASLLLYPLPPVIPLQPYAIGGGHVFFASYNNSPSDYENDWDDDYGNGYHLGAGLDIQLDDIILNFEARRLWINEDRWGITDREGFRATIGMLFIL